jgi:hypothetical protein
MQACKHAIVSSRLVAIELQVVSAAGEDGHSTSEKHVVSLVTKRLQELGLDVEEIDEQHKVQIDHVS